jgi:integrase
MATIVNGKRRGRPGRWLVDYYDGNGDRRLITCRTRKVAKAHLAKVLRESEQPRNSTVDRNITLGDYAKRWLAQVRVRVKPATYESYEAMLRRHVLPGIGKKVRLQRVSRGQILDLLVKKLQTEQDGGPGLARNTVRLIHGTLRALLTAAKENDEIITDNPALGLGKSLKLVTPPKARSEEIKAFTAEQLSTFLTVTTRVSPVSVPLFRTLAWTGMRLGEGLGLQWPDVNFEQGTIRIQRSVSRRGEVGTPKTGSRTVDMGPALAKTLLRLRMTRADRMRRYEWAKMPPWLFCTKSGRTFDRQHVGKVFRRVLRAARLPVHFTPHGLRHSYASILLQRGESQTWVQRQLGHASIQMTVDLYGRWLPPRTIQGGVMLLEGLTGGQSGDKMVAKSPEGAENRPKHLAIVQSATVSRATPAGCR